MEKKRQGLSLSEIAKYLPERCYTSIKGRSNAEAARSNLPPGRKRKKLSQVEPQRIIDMRVREAKSFSEIAIAFNRPYGSITSAWNRACPKLMSATEWEKIEEAIRNKIRWTAEELKHLLELHRRGDISGDDAALHFPSRTDQAVRMKTKCLLLEFPKRKT